MKTPPAVALLLRWSQIFALLSTVSCFSVHKRIAAAGPFARTATSLAPRQATSDVDSSSVEYESLERTIELNGQPNGLIPTRKNEGLNGYSLPNGASRYHDMLDERGRFIRRIFSPQPPVILNEETEDGWEEMRKEKPLPFWKKTAKLPFLTRETKEPGTLILVRHGESKWNANRTFTGWADPDLSSRGVREVEHAARLLLEGGYEIDVVFTSRLTRAIRSARIILQEMNQVYLPVFKSWRLNERMYGALTGLCKKDTAVNLGSELVQEWRGSLRSRPPALGYGDKYWPGKERRYADLSLEQIPLTESLMDCMERAAPVWDEKIMYELRNGRNVMVVAHANTLRGLVKIIDDISDQDIQEVAIPTGIPIVYKFSKHMKPIPPEGDRQSAFQLHMKGLFMEKPGLLAEALKREEEWSNQIPGYNPTMGRVNTPMGSLERSLYKLRAERELGQWAGQFVDPNAVDEDSGDDGNGGKPMKLVEQDAVWAEGLEGLQSGEQFDPDAPIFHPDTSVVSTDFDDDGFDVMPNLISSSPCVTSMPSSSIVPGLGKARVRKDSVIVMIRHGKTEHNKLGLFTGWEDAPLAQDGVDEAKEAGRLLKAHGFEFDVVYSSWLSRAIETAWHVMDEMDCLWLPIIKTWRLNERMYGQLTGLSKQMVKQRHGDAQFKAWRRGYKTPPPKVSSFSQHYPGNDRRYQKYLGDLRYSVRETLIRCIENGKFELHRKLPKSESLKDCMDRTIPFFTERIVPEAVDQGKRVLISSSENAIRGLLMHMLEIPEDKIAGLEIPNGLPLIFDTRSKCVKLLDDGTGRDPLEVHNFGNAAKYLFRPCTNEDGSLDEECDIQFMGEPDIISAEDQALIDSIKDGRIAQRREKEKAATT